MKTKKYKITDLSDDEISKVHLRYMSGGRAPNYQMEKQRKFSKLIFPKGRSFNAIFRSIKR